MHNLTLNIKNDAYEHLIYFISKIGNDIEIVKDEIIKPLDIENITKDEEDYQLYLEAKQRREDGEKSYSLDAVLKDFE